jgi:hypothetical protein
MAAAGLILGHLIVIPAAMFFFMVVMAPDAPRR